MVTAHHKRGVTRRRQPNPDRPVQVAVVLPTFNEAANLGLLVQDLEQRLKDLHIVVVDDNSPDGTQQVARRLASDFGNVTVIGRPAKLGLGSALRDGLNAALATGARYIVAMDADCSHDPRDVPRLLQAIRTSGADMVQGSRYVGGGGIRGWGLKRWLLSRAANLLYHWCAGAPHDSTGNFRIFSRRAASLIVARAKGQNYEFVPEVTLLVLAAGLRVGELPIVFTDRVRGDSKLGKGQVIRGFTFFCQVTLQYRLHLGRFRRLTAAGRNKGGKFVDGIVAGE